MSESSNRDKVDAFLTVKLSLEETPLVITALCNNIKTNELGKKLERSLHVVLHGTYAIRKYINGYLDPIFVEPKGRHSVMREAFVELYDNKEEHEEYDLYLLEAPK